MGVAVFVDPAAGIPLQVAAGQGITVLPSLSADNALHNARGYVEHAVSQGATEIVSVHPWAMLEPGCEVMGRLAEALGDRVPVHVVDSESLGMGTGWVALAAAGAAGQELFGAQVRDLAVRVAKRTSVVVAAAQGSRLHLLSLASGGGGFGGLLPGRPLCRLAHAQVRAAGKLRRTGAGTDRLIELVQGCASRWDVHVTVQHDGEPDAAYQLAADLGSTGMAVLGGVEVVPFGPQAVAWAGAGALGVAISPVDWHD
ncbi:MAG: hypothetical protein CSA58_06265, partial [Micrococcales bacterium]